MQSGDAVARCAGGAAEGDWGRGAIAVALDGVERDGGGKVFEAEVSAGFEKLKN